MIADLVMNHTSSDHPWFQESRSSPDSPKRDWYVWSDNTDRYKDARIIFIDTEASNWTWDPVAGAFFDFGGSLPRNFCSAFSTESLVVSAMAIILRAPLPI